jgi:2-methylisocitrate lyase-like PEP mutase family enzyme
LISLTIAQMPSIAEKRHAFRRLHEAGCFVIPNPWDAGSARYLQHLGFKALASTSGGYAFSIGRADGQVPRDAMLAHLRQLVEATDLPVNADLESGYGADANAVAESVRLCVATGVAGLSIEDSTRDKTNPLYEIDEAVTRIKAARAAIDGAGGDTLLVGRAECFLAGRPNLYETIKRLKAYSDAGADCLYAPGLKTRAQIEEVVQALAPKPVNVLMSSPAGFTVADLAAMGVRRISVGSALARVAWGAVMRAARELADAGRFEALAGGAPGAELNALFRQDRNS